MKVSIHQHHADFITDHKHLTLFLTGSIFPKENIANITNVFLEGDYLPEKHRVIGVYRAEFSEQHVEILNRSEMLKCWFDSELHFSFIDKPCELQIYNQENILKRFNETSIRNKSVCLIGCGSWGSTVASNLVKSGLGAITLLDFDRLSPSNLSRHELNSNHLNRKKNVALASELKAINPTLETQVYDDIFELNTSEIDRVFSDCDLIINLTDNILTASKCNEYSYFFNIPFIDGGSYIGSSCGEISYYLPKDSEASQKLEISTPCWDCTNPSSITKNVDHVDYDDPNANPYITPANNGLAVDVAIGSSLLSAIALSLLQPENIHRKLALSKRPNSNVLYFNTGKLPSLEDEIIYFFLERLNTPFNIIRKSSFDKKEIDTSNCMVCGGASLETALDFGA